MGGYILPGEECAANRNQADITDPQHHFETEVPARALKEPVLRYAIFAFSSRHLDRLNTSDVTEALQYHNCCVQLLIPALAGPQQHITEDILAAVAILRQHEEMDGELRNRTNPCARPTLMPFRGGQPVPSHRHDSHPEYGTSIWFIWWSGRGRCLAVSAPGYLYFADQSAAASYELAELRSFGCLP